MIWFSFSISFFIFLPNLQNYFKISGNFEWIFLMFFKNFCKLCWSNNFLNQNFINSQLIKNFSVPAKVGSTTKIRKQKRRNRNNRNLSAFFVHYFHHSFFLFHFYRVIFFSDNAHLIQIWQMMSTNEISYIRFMISINLHVKWPVIYSHGTVTLFKFLILLCPLKKLLFLQWEDLSGNFLRTYDQSKLSLRMFSTPNNIFPNYNKNMVLAKIKIQKIGNKLRIFLPLVVNLHAEMLVY